MKTATLADMDNVPSWWHPLLLLVYLVPIFIQFIYTLARATNLFRAIVGTFFFTNCPAQDAGKIPNGQECPIVTIQICTYNEGSVVQETIRRACNVDWPRERLFVDVCDDSTDDDSVAVVERSVAYWRSQGVNIRHCRRPDRIGYKAGNLNHHFPSIQGEFVANFDADHRMESTFLKCAMAHFYDKSGNLKPKIGLVQAPWSHYNMHQNLLTEADSLGIDVHHTIEQTGRSAALSMFGFNGTGGIWRKSAIADAGGWCCDAVTEDLALSYKAYLQGYRFIYVRDIPQQLESPSCILAHIQQRHRWTKGFLQVLRISFLEVLGSRDTSTAVKCEAFLHMTSPLLYTCTFIVTAVYPLLVVHGIDSDWIRILWLVPHSVPLLEAVTAAYVKVPAINEKYRGTFNRTLRLIFVLPLFALKYGMMFFETKAIIDGLTSNDSTFLTTPKVGSIGKPGGKTTTKSVNKVHHSWREEVIAWFGIGFAIYRLAFFYSKEVSSIGVAAEITLSTLWFHFTTLCVCLGVLWVHGTFLMAMAQKLT